MKFRTFLVCLTIAAAALAAPLVAEGAGSKVYVATAIGEIYAVDAETGTVTLVHQLGLMSGDFDVAMCSDGRLYVSAGDRIARLRTDGTESEIVFSNLDVPLGSELSTLFPGGLACDSSGNLLIASKFHQTVAVWRLPDITAAPFGGPFAAPTAVAAAVTGSGEEIVTLHDGRIAVVTMDGRVDVFTRQFGASAPLIASTGEAPIGFAQNTAGDLFVADVAAVARYDGGGNFVENVFDADSPYRIDVALNGRLFVTSDNGLWQVDPAGSPQFIASIPFARGVAVDRLLDPPDARTLTFGPGNRVARVQYGNATVQIRYLGKPKQPFDVTLERRLAAPSSLKASLRRNIDPIAFPGDSGFVTILTIGARASAEAYVAEDGDHADNRGRDRAERDDDDEDENEDDDEDDDEDDGRFRLEWAFNFDGTLGRPRLMAEQQRRNSTLFKDELSFFSRAGANGKDMVGTIRHVAPGSQLFLANERSSSRR